MTERRFFNGRERAALYLAAGGRCAECGVDLEPGWHADHQQPHSKGGATDVVNGQALCAACNLHKGSRTSMSPTELSAWQQEALRKFRGTDTDFLAVACPGAGKTRFALAAARHMLDVQNYSRIIVVVPTRTLRSQWARDSHPFGIELDSNFENGGGLGSDFSGVVVTYAAVASQPLLYRHLASAQSLVIFDEIHHAGDAQSWGQALREAFELAGRRLLLSGTPRRTDATEVPFVTYDDRGAFIEDYLYDYGRALEDYRVDSQGKRVPVVRPADFHVQDGTARWSTASEAEVKLQLSKADDSTMSNALRSALEPGGEWIDAVLNRADLELTDKRRTVPDAAGLVVAYNQIHARQYANLLSKITGEQTTVAISDEPAATKSIEQFKSNRSRWIVAVQMVSEGVDIPRLAVCVYATQTRTEMFFRQVVGRVVRSRGSGDIARASMFVPGVEPLVRYAADIERTTRIALETKDAREAAEREPSLPGLGPTILGAEDAIDAGTISHGEQFSASELDRARAMIASNGFPTDTSAVVMAAFVRNHLGPVAEAAPQPASEAPLAERKKKARQTLTRLVGRVAYHCYDGHFDAPAVRYDLRAKGFPPVDECSFEQLEDQIRLLGACLESGERVA